MSVSDTDSNYALAVRADLTDPFLKGCAVPVETFELNMEGRFIQVVLESTHPLRLGPGLQYMNINFVKIP